MMRYNPALDGVRAVAVAMVMAFHAKTTWMEGGYFGVDIFFVLSGYLITSLLVTELGHTRRIDLVGFYARRLLRLAPALALLLVVYLVAAPWLFPRTPFSTITRDAIVVLMYFSDYTQALFGYPERLVHTWSLAVEEHFYLIWPLLLGLFFKFVPRDRTPRGAFIVFAVIAFLLATNWRLLEAGLGHSWSNLYYRFDTHASGLLLGCLLGAIFSGHTVAGGKVPAVAGWLQLALLSGLLAMGYAMTWQAWGYPQGYLTCIELVAAALVVTLVLWPTSWMAGVLSLAPISYIGRISYGIYLWDYPTGYVLRSRFPELSPETLLALTAVIAVSMASISYFTVEKAARRLKPRTYAIGKSATP